MPSSPRKPVSEPRQDRSPFVAIVIVAMMGLLLIFGFDFIVAWLGRLFGL